MKIHEFQAKGILREYGVAVLEGFEVTTVEEAVSAAEQLGGVVQVVKAQVHAGGRGKGGGVKLVRSAEEARAAAEAMLGKPLVTHQTGPEGRIVHTIYVESGSDIDRELYLAVAVDRESASPVMIAATEGGVEIEELAAENPDAILRERIHPVKGLLPYQMRRMAFRLGFSKTEMKGAMTVMAGLARMFVDLDCSIAEINPLITTDPFPNMVGTHRDGSCAELVSVPATSNRKHNPSISSSSSALPSGESDTSTLIRSSRGSRRRCSNTPAR